MNLKKDVVIYLFGELFSKLTPFLLLPIVARQYGADGTYFYTTYILLVFITQSLMTGWLLPYLALSFIRSQRTYQYLYYANSLFLCCFFMIMLAIISVEFWLLQSGLLLTISISILGGAGSSMFALFLSAKQYKKQSKKYVTSNVLRSIVYLAFSIIGVYYFNLSIYELMLGHAVNSFLHGCLFSSRELKTHKFKGRVKPAIFIYPIKYGLPLLPGIILNNVRTGLDRFLLGISYSVTIVGLYAASYQLASIVMVLSTALTKAVGPTVLRFAINQESNKIRNVFLFFCLTLLFSSLFTAVVIEYFGVIILGEEFSEIHKFSMLPLIFLFQGINGFFVIQFQAEKKTGDVLKINLVSMLIYSIIVSLSVSQSINYFLLSLVCASALNCLLTFHFGGKKMLSSR